jgi:3'-5' exoribonuclease
VVLGERLLVERIGQIADFPRELALRLSHMVLSHHGRYEWGSPRRPMTLEACALHYLENLNVEVNRFAQIIAAQREGAAPWTEYDRLLRRYLYAGRREDLVIEERGQLEELEE